MFLSLYLDRTYSKIIVSYLTLPNFYFITYKAHLIHAYMMLIQRSHSFHKFQCLLQVLWYFTWYSNNSEETQ